MQLPCLEGTEVGDGIFAGMEFWEARRPCVLPALKWFPALKQKTNSVAQGEGSAPGAGNGIPAPDPCSVGPCSLPAGFGCSPVLPLPGRWLPRLSHSRNARRQLFWSSGRPRKGSGCPHPRPARRQSQFQARSAVVAVFGIVPPPPARGCCSGPARVPITRCGTAW